jgi:hypothetical protein
VNSLGRRLVLGYAPGIMVRARIIGTGSYAPEQILTNDDLSKRIETSDEWIQTRTGIRERHIAREDEQTSDMAVAAARRALEMAGKTPADLDLIIVGTISGDMPMPACAAFVQAKLGARCPRLRRLRRLRRAPSTASPSPTSSSAPARQAPCWSSGWSCSRASWTGRTATPACSSATPRAP